MVLLGIWFVLMVLRACRRSVDLYCAFEMDLGGSCFCLKNRMMEKGNRVKIEDCGTS